GLKSLDARGAKFDRRDIGNVGKGPCRHTAWRRAGLCRVDGDDAAMRVLRAHDAHMELAGEGRLHGEASLAAHERRILEPRQRTPDMLHGIRSAAARTALTMFS